MNREKPDREARSIAGHSAETADVAVSPETTVVTPRAESELPATIAGRSAAVTAEQPSLPRLANYEVIAEIARGGMGIVFKAQQLVPRRIVALKMIRAGKFADDGDVRRFRAEADAAAHLEHPGIVP